MYAIFDLICLFYWIIGNVYGYLVNEWTLCLYFVVICHHRLGYRWEPVWSWDELEATMSSLRHLYERMNWDDVTADLPPPSLHCCILLCLDNLNTRQDSRWLWRVLCVLLTHCWDSSSVICELLIPSLRGTGSCQLHSSSLSLSPSLKEERLELSSMIF